MLQCLRSAGAEVRRLNSAGLTQRSPVFLGDASRLREPGLVWTFLLPAHYSHLGYFRSGNAKTYSAFPVAGECTSGSIVAGTFRGLPPPLPVGTATYCFPSTMKVIGKP